MNDDAERMRAYLLGQLEPSAEEAFELEVFGATDDAPVQALERAEAELLDAMAAGELSASDEAALTRRLERTSQGRERLAFARALHASAEASRGTVAEPDAATEARPWWRSIWVHLATATAVIAALVGLQLLGPEGPPGLSVSLEPTVLRSSATPPSIRLAQGQSLTLRLKLEADERGDAFGVEVRSGTSVTTRRTGVAPTKAREVVVTLQASEWSPGRMVVTLAGLDGQPLAFYDIDVVAADPR